MIVIQRSLSVILLCFLLFTSESLYSQPRDGGQMVVPIGWESEDSIRFGLFDFNGGGNSSSVNALADSIQANFRHEWGVVNAGDPLYGKRKGVMAYPALRCTGPSLWDIGQFLKQRIYYASPLRFNFRFTNGYWWRYIDTMNNPSAKFSYNPYDSNDISPFIEFQKNQGYVASDYTTKRYNAILDQVVDSTFKYGNYGKLLVGFSDDRIANSLLKTTDRYPFPDTWRMGLFFRYKNNDWSCLERQWVPNRNGLTDAQLIAQLNAQNFSGPHDLDTIANELGPVPDTAKTFAAIVEFNVDTTAIIDTLWSGASDDIPLIRLQILFKKGNDSSGSGWSVLPFVPFRDALTITDSRFGWYAVVDTVITRKIYRQLDHSWRERDSLGAGGYAQPWRFKQLHVQLKPENMTTSMKGLIQATIPDSTKVLYGSPSGSSLFTTSLGQDTLVGEVDDPSFEATFALIETRILSSYRATVRLRSLTWQDEVVDKFLYRRRVGDSDSTFACKPDGSSSGKDDSVKIVIDAWASVLGSARPRELMFNDMPLPFTGLTAGPIAYVDYMASKQNIHAHIREQEIGSLNWSGHFRRERLSYDGEPPSIYENQIGGFYSNAYNYKNEQYNGYRPADVFPIDYLYYGKSINTALPWPSKQDSMVGLILGRVDTSDVLKAYRRYTDIYGGLNVLSLGFRSSAYVALNHPRNKRFALEVAPQGWGLLFHTSKNNYNGRQYGDFDPHYNQRITTPEETIGHIYLAIANGATALNFAQCYDYSDTGGASPGAFHAVWRDFATGGFPTMETTYNFGNHRHGSQWRYWDTTGLWLGTPNETCEKDEIDSGYYLGYRNTYKAFQRVLSRLNQVYDTNSYNKKYPFKRLEWLDAYSAYKGIPGSTDSTDRSTYLGSFIRAFCTTPVKRWERTAINGYQQYIDSTDGGGNLVPDSAHRTYVEVGLFRDNPGETLKGYAAMVVNTRLWPSLRDAEDSIYYNQGLDSAKDRSKSTLGDIDTRKAWFKLDTVAFPPHFRSSYYVIRDVWHHDTTYLVHCDSSFGVYMKPGEARLLYIEKDISIRTAPKAATAVNEFGFNNGRRVAEILRGRQSVVTYTRVGKLYVNYPGAGERFEGYNERSAGENIATGYELCIDSSGTCHRPSICAGMNDTAVAITYWSSELGGRVKVAYQKKPYDPWIFATATDPIPDTTSDHSGVTPVIAPYASLTQFHPIDSSHLVVFKDSIWLVAASYLNLGTKATGIICLRFKVNASGIQYLDDSPDQFFHFDGVTPVLSDRSAFPTITSRALHYIHDNPIRLAWQKSGKIFYNQYKDTSLVLTPAGAPECISDGLPSLCYNYHPSIAMNCVKVLPSTGIKGYDGSGQTAQTKSGPIPDTNIYMHDYVVWESKLNGKKWNSGTHFWPVLRSRYEKLEWMRPNPAKWNSFQVFKPKIDTTNFHWPVVSAGSRVDTFLFGSSYARNLKAYHERLRIAWFDDAVDSMEFVHYPNSIKRTILNEGGTRPSLPQPTYYIKRMSDSSMIQPSVAFMGLQKDNSLNHTRITNGWFPMVSTAKKALIFPSIQIIIKADTITKCPQVVKKIDIGPPSIIKTGGGTPQVNWKPTDVGGDLGIFPNDWPLIPTNPVEFSSDTFRVTALDSIIVPRKLDSLDITSLRNGLYDNSDYYIQKILLKRHLDSSYVGTVDSIFISKTAARYPGNALHPTFAKYEHPLGMPTDSVFLSIEVLRGNTANLLERGFTEYIQDDDIATMAFKQVSDAPSDNIREEQIPITMEIYPNPLSLNATVEVVTPDGVQTLIELYDINGKRISTLFDGSSSGKLTLTLEGKDLTNGIYFLRTQCGNSVVTKKVELLK